MVLIANNFQKSKHQKREIIKKENEKKKKSGNISENSMSISKAKNIWNICGRRSDYVTRFSLKNINILSDPIIRHQILIRRSGISDRINLIHKLVSLSCHVLLQFLHRCFQLLHLLQTELFDWVFPPALLPSRYPLLLQHISSLSFAFQLIHELAKLRIQFVDIGVPARLDGMLARARVQARASTEKAVEDGFDIRVAKREWFLCRGEDYDGDFHAAESAKLTCLLEETRPAFRERYLKVIFLWYFGHGYLFPTLARLLRHFFFFF